MREIGVIGGGMLGLALAWRLHRDDTRVTVIEGAERPGGLAASQSIGGFTWDRFYHVILKSDRHLHGLLDEIGLADQLEWGTTRTGFYSDGRLHSMSTSLEFLAFPLLSLVDKARLAATIVHASRITNWQALEQVRATDWLRRWSGQRTLERIWLPLLKSKLGDNYRLASAAFIWAIIARMYAARRSGLKREEFGYVRGGYDTVLTRFTERLAERGVEFVCGRPVTRVTGSDAGAEVCFERHDPPRTFDAVVLTTPCSRVDALCPQLTDPERERLRSVVYQGIVCASLLTRRPLGGFYVTNLTDDWVPFTAVIETTALVDRARFGGHSLIYLPRYLTQGDEFWRRSNDQIRAEFIAALARMYPGFTEADVAAFQVARAREVLALATLNYSAASLPPVVTSIPNVFVVNSAQIASGTLNVNETVALANAKATELARQVDRIKPRLQVSAARRAIS